jgi:hypothetical protein
MATIPQIVTSPGAVPGTPSAPSGGGLVRASPQMDVRAPSDPSAAQAAGANIEAQALESTARSSEKIAAYGEQFADQYVKAKLNIDAANRTADLSAQLHEAEFQSSKIADRDAATADFNGRVSKIRDDFAAADVNPRVRAAVDANLPNQIALRLASTQQASFKLWSQAQVGSLITNLDQYNKQAVDSPDPRMTETIIGLANAAIDGRADVHALGADVAAKMKVDFGSNVYRTKIEIAMAKDMASGVALYNATRSKLNGADALAMGKVAEDRGKQLDADHYVSQNMPVTGSDANERVHNAIVGQESGGRQVDASGKTLESPRGAFGAGQITKGTFDQFARPGESIDNREDNLRVSKRITDHYMEKYGGDWQRAAVAYFSGEGNVAPPGSPTPWKTDSSDGRVKTSEYVAQVGSRLGGSADPGQAEDRRLRELRFIDRIQNDPNMDPEKRARIVATARQRSSTQDGIQAAQTAQVKDQEEQAAVAFATGKGKDGTWQQIADAFGRVGDFGKRDAYQSMADNESMFKNFASATPEEQRRMAPFLPGVAGQVARAVIAEGTADRAVIRGEAQRTEDEARKLIAEPSSDARATLKVAEDAITGYLRAGTSADIAKATALRETLGGMIEGKVTGGLPRAEAEAVMARIQEKAQNGGYTRAEAAQIGILRKQMEHTENLRNKDPINLGTEVFGPVTPFPFQGTPEEQAKAMQVRLDRARQIDSKWFPGAGQPITPVFTAQEIAQKVQILKTGSVENRQTEARRLAAILPREQITILAKHLGGDGADGLSSAIAEAIPKYASGDQAEIEIANSIIRGANRLYESGEAGKVKTDPTLSVTLTNTLAAARISGGWDGRDIKRQDHAIMSRYVDLRGPKDLTLPDTSTDLPQAIKDVVGEPHSSWSHGDVLLPKGVDSSTFNTAVDLIKPSDIPPLRPARDGRPFTDQMIRDKGIFATVGNGVYKMRMKDPTDGIVRDLIQQDGKPWIIDMKPLFTRAGGATFDPDTGRPQ